MQCYPENAKSMFAPKCHNCTHVRCFPNAAGATQFSGSGHFQVCLPAPLSSCSFLPTTAHLALAVRSYIPLLTILCLMPQNYLKDVLGSFIKVKFVLFLLCYHVLNPRWNAIKVLIFGRMGVAYPYPLLCCISNLLSQTTLTVVLCYQ